MDHPPPIRLTASTPCDEPEITSKPARRAPGLHTLVAEGMWVEDACGVRFEPLRVTQADVEAVVATVCRRVGRLLVRRGLVEEGCAPSV